MAEIGGLDLASPSINDQAELAFTYNGNGDVETLTYTWYDTQTPGGLTHTWTQTLTYNGTELQGISGWVHAAS